jgi:hypothetical protein
VRAKQNKIHENNLFLLMHSILLLIFYHWASNIL